MREILFRGFHPCENGTKTITIDGKEHKGKWIDGYFFKIWHEYYILWGTTNGIPNMLEVFPETVGQWTGLTDKNGKKIFEGDIVKFTDSWGKTPKQGTAEIGFEHSAFKYSGRYDGGNPIVWLSVSDMSVTFEVIGTIFDKKEEL